MFGMYALKALIFLGFSHSKFIPTHSKKIEEIVSIVKFL